MMSYLRGVEFAHGYLLWLLLLVPVLLVWWLYRDRDRRDGLRFSSLSLFGGRRLVTWRVVARYVPMVLFLLGLSALIVALARPQRQSVGSTSTTLGIDMVISLDVSGSMLARDFDPDRLEAAKRIGINFVSGRSSDRMGLVIFAGEAYTMCPLTTDLSTLINQFNAVEMGVLEDGTAIGSGLAMAVARLQASDAVSRVVILLTDGVNNSGEIAPYTAAEIAAVYGIRVYVVGIGSEGTAPYPIQTPLGIRYQQVPVEIDEPLMREIATLTGGRYFRATDNKALEQIYAEIDQLERSQIQVDQYTQRHEAFAPYLLAGLLLVAAALLMNYFVIVLPSQR